ncbi:hypothetical protein [Paenibacillus sp. P46E]|uniref:hypothetical protein n=1 Tax=Paenibacillus sp. P46E TaxID=1349436 RepID=UPI00095B96F5|nr:hypothetical protein [Paenibacillus sp. P46E]OKP94392.1 hypothetical protein A3849_29295 [Paenibacillus sp. P46E]
MFRLLEVKDTQATYHYGDCSENYEGVFELDIVKLLSGEIKGDTPMSEVVKILKPCISESSNQHKANRAFGKIYKHFQETNEYIKDGGFYS